MGKRLKSGPRTPYGYLDAALQRLIVTAMQEQALGNGPDELDNERRAIVQRVRRIVRAEVKAAASSFYLGKFGE